MGEPIQDGDNGFQGVNMRLDPGLLPDGFCSEAVNKRFINGVAKTRPGIAVMNWSNSAEDYYENKTYSSGEIVHFNGLEDDDGTVSLMDGAELYNGVTPTATPSGPIAKSTVDSSGNVVGPYFKATGSTSAAPISAYNAGTNVSTIATNWSNLGVRTFPFTNVKGAGAFRDPNGSEWLLVATASGVYATREGNQAFKLSGVTSITTDVTFVQAFNVVLMFQGEDVAPMVMELIADGFSSISQSSSDTTIDENDSDGTEAIPNATTALFSGNRVWVPVGDLVHVSDYLNYTRYAPVRSTLRINQGSEDNLVALHKFDENTIIAFKEASIFAVRNTYGNLVDMNLDELSRSYGCIAAKSITTVGRDIWFLDRSGVRSLGVTESGKVQGVDKPVSDAIQPLIDRIAWPSAHKSVAAYHNNRYFLAVPIDGSTECNVVLSYDFQTNTWAGMDDGAAIGGTLTETDSGKTFFGVKDFATLTYAGAKRLFFVSTKGTINLYDDYEFGGIYDQTLETDSSSANYGKVSQSNVTDKLVTRGFSGGVTWPKNWREVVCETATNNPQFSVSVAFDGVGESDSLATNTTFSRTIYDRPFGKADFVESNTGDDYLTKFRQDYSWDCDTGILSQNLGTGIDPDKKQTHLNRYRLFGNGRFMQVTISNSQGRMEIANVGVLGVKGQALGRRQI